VLGLVQILAAVLTLLIPHIPWFGLLIAVMVLKGITGGLINTGANALMLWTHGDAASPFINALHFFFGFGSFISPFLFGLVLSAGAQYGASFTLLAVIGGAVGLYQLWTSRFAIPMHKPEPAAQAGGIAAGALPIAFAAAFFLFFYVGSEIAFGGWVYTYALGRGLADAAGGAYLTSLFWLAFTVGRLAAIPLSVRIPPQRVIPAAVAGGVAFLLLIIAVPDSTAVLWLGAAGIGFCMAPIWPAGYNLAGRSIRMTSQLSSLILLGDSLGGMMLPSALGAVIERAGNATMMPIVMVSLAATFLAFLAMRVLARRREAPA
jgi:FHS family Na+ dependent glucose MFS transporter 1